MRRITLKDVARAAGVAPATASHAMNATGTVSQATIARVRTIADELGYRPDMIAANLRQGRTSTLGVLIPSLTNPFYAELVEALEMAARVKNYSVLGGATNHDEALERHYINLFLSRRCDGIIVIMGRERIGDVIRAGTPTLLVNSHLSSALAPAPTIEVDDEYGMYAATCHLAALGHRHIGFITFPGVDLRQQGYRRALAENGLPYRPALVVQTEHVDCFEACDAVQHLLSAHPEITALAAAADVLALGIIRAARLVGREIPRDLAIVGFDNIKFAAISVPSLTSVAQPIGAIADHALDLMLRQITGTELDQRRVLLRPELVVRESSGGRKEAGVGQACD